MVSPLVWSIFIGKNADLTSGLDCNYIDIDVTPLTFRDGIRFLKTGYTRFLEPDNAKIGFEAQKTPFYTSKIRKPTI